MGQVVIQKLNKQEPSELELAIRYFTIIGAVTGVHLTRKQIQLLAWTAIKGTISSGGAIKDFITTFDSSKGTLENLKASLIKKGFIVKQEGKYRLIPSLSLSFQERILLQINISQLNGTN